MKAKYEEYDNLEIDQIQNQNFNSSRCETNSTIETLINKNYGEVKFLKNGNIWNFEYD